MTRIPLRPAFLLALISSCEQPQVKTYTESAAAVAPRQSGPAKLPPMMGGGKMAALPQGTDSIVGAIFRESEAMWFLKVAGARSETGAIGEGLVSLLGSIDFKGQEAVWSLPKGWSELPGEGFRYRSFKVEGTNLDISLTRMPPGNDLQANLDRWAGQLGLGPLTEEELAAAVTEMKLGKRQVLMVSLRKPEAEAPAGAAPAPGSHGFRFVLPPLWQQKPATSMRLVNLAGPEGAELTVSSMAQGNPALQLGAMWANQVGLPEPDAAALAKLAWACGEIDGIKAEGWAFDGTERFIRVARIDRAGASWYFKLSGPVAAKAQIASFEAFLKSFAFEAAK
ncbi:MAG: hypothetical protein RL095_3897 [Verrucomicrobiota bacterium]|jgi:hypothetical protein